MLLIAFALLTSVQVNAWTVDLAKPRLVIGADVNDTAQMFTNVVGATRLPNGNIMVGDYAANSLHLFSAEGKRLKTFGRKGEGPGEFGCLARFFRCGDSVVTYDIRNGNRASVFTLDGKFVRMFRFGSPEKGNPPYSAGSACNRGMTFVHYGWGPNGMPQGVFRPSVPFWIGNADSSVRNVFANLPGSERYTAMSEGRAVGTSPLPFGRQTSQAIASDRVYVGVADRYEILVFDLTGRGLPSIAKAGAAQVPVTPADIAAEKEKRLATLRPDRHAQFEREFPLIPFPKVFPPYDRLVVDSDDNLWVRDYPRQASSTVRWTVFGRNRTLLATVVLPRDLDVFEIGRDYVLGRYLDPEEAIPHVRLYSLRRGS